MLEKIKNFIVLIFMVFVISGVLIFSMKAFSSLEDKKEDNSKIVVNIEDTAILQKVNDLNKLETIEQIYQRDVEITIDQGDFEIFGMSILENKRTQKLAITGNVIAGIDMSKIEKNDVEIKRDFESDKTKLTINLPAPEVFSANILQDQTKIEEDDLTILFKINNLTESNRREANNLLLDEVLSQGKNAMMNSACDGKILEKANENARKNLENFFGNLIFDEVSVNIQEGKCEL